MTYIVFSFNEDEPALSEHYSWNVDGKFLFDIVIYEWTCLHVSSCICGKGKGKPYDHSKLKQYLLHLVSLNINIVALADKAILSSCRQNVLHTMFFRNGINTMCDRRLKQLRLLVVSYLITLFTKSVWFESSWVFFFSYHCHHIRCINVLFCTLYHHVVQVNIFSSIWKHVLNSYLNEVLLIVCF